MASMIFLMPVEAATASHLLVPCAAAARNAAQGPGEAMFAAETACSAAQPSGSLWITWGRAATAAASVVAVVSTRSIHRRNTMRRALSEAASVQENAPSVGRAGLLRSLGATGAATALPFSVLPEAASAKSFTEANEALAKYGLPELSLKEEPPFAWRVTVEAIGLAPDSYYGKSKLGGEPLVVTFNTPPGWVTTKPTIDYNGAGGTVSANDYGKGDSATLWVDTNFKGDIKTMGKNEFQDELKKALTQKGKNFIEDLKVKKVYDGAAAGYKIIEYAYDIESAAGFTIARTGLAVAANVGDEKNLQVFWAAAVTGRWNKIQEDLTRMINSFRIGKIPKGIVQTEFKNMDESISKEDIKRRQEGGFLA